MNEVDTFTAFIKVKYSLARGLMEPGEQAQNDQQLYTEELGELMDVVRRGYEDDAVDVVVLYDQEEATLADDAEADALIHDRFALDEWE